MVHVVYRTQRENISNARVSSQIHTLNEDFRKKNSDRSKVPDVFKPLHSDRRIQLRLASKDIFGNASSGITRTRTSVPSFSLDDGVKSSRTSRPRSRIARATRGRVEAARRARNHRAHPGSAGTMRHHSRGTPET